MAGQPTGYETRGGSKAVITAAPPGGDQPSPERRSAGFEVFPHGSEHRRWIVVFPEDLMRLASAADQPETYLRLGDALDRGPRQYVTTGAWRSFCDAAGEEIIDQCGVYLALPAPQWYLRAATFTSCLKYAQRALRRHLSGDDASKPPSFRALFLLLKMREPRGGVNTTPSQTEVEQFLQTQGPRVLFLKDAPAIRSLSSLLPPDPLLLA